MSAILIVAALLTLMALATAYKARRFRRSRFHITHTDNTHIELYNPVRRQTVRLTLFAVLEPPLSSPVLESRFDEALSFLQSLFLRSVTPLRYISGSGKSNPYGYGYGSTFVPANACREDIRVSRARNGIRLSLAYVQSENGAAVRRIHIRHTFTFS